VEYMKEYAKNMKEYVKNMKEYEEIICQYIYWIWYSHIYMGLGTWKNSTPELPPGLWDLETNFHRISVIAIKFDQLS